MEDWAKVTTEKVNNVPESLSTLPLSNRLLNTAQVNGSEAHRKQGARAERSVVKHHSIIHHSDTRSPVSQLHVSHAAAYPPSEPQLSPASSDPLSSPGATMHRPRARSQESPPRRNPPLAKRDWTDGRTHPTAYLATQPPSDCDHRKDLRQRKRYR